MVRMQLVEERWEGDALHFGVGALGHTVHGRVDIEDSLVRIEDGPETGPRIRLLHTIREFAMEQLERSGEMDAILRAHARWYAEMVIDTPTSTWRCTAAMPWCRARA